MKKGMCFVLSFIMLLSLCSMSVSADCGYGHGDDFLSYSCSGATSEVKTPTCHWAGGYGGGEYHGSNCQIVQTYCYTTETCTASECSHSAQSGSHLCYASHSQSNMNVDVCPY